MDYMREPESSTSSLALIDPHHGSFPSDDREPTHWKRPWCWERLRAGGEGGNRGWDGWHHQLNGHEFEQIPENMKDREAWCAAVHGFAKSQTRLSDWTTKTSNTWVYFKPEVNKTEALSPALCAKMHFAYSRCVGYRLGASQSCMSSFCCSCHDGNYALLLWNVLCTPERGNVSVREPNLPPERKVCLISG